MSRGWMDRTQLAALAVLLTALAGCGASLPETPPSSLSVATNAGRDIAAARCAECHALPPAEVSALPGAPKLSELAGRYDMAVLAEELAQGVHVGGGAMPKFDLSLAEIDALTNYLNAISESEAR